MTCAPQPVVREITKTGVNMGVGIRDAHTTRESISTYDLYKAARLPLKIVTDK